MLHKDNPRTLNLHNMDCTIEGNDGSSVSMDNTFSVNVTLIRLIASVHSNDPLESSDLGAENAPLEVSGLCSSNSPFSACNSHIALERSLVKVSGMERMVRS